MFITEEDYRVVIGDSAMKVLSQASDSTKSAAEKTAITEIESYLRPKYDCSAIFSAEGEQRNQLIVMYACDIALFHMVASQPARMGYEVRKERYDMAISWLGKVQSGDVVPDLPLDTSEAGISSSPIMYGGIKQHQTIW